MRSLIEQLRILRKRLFGRQKGWPWPQFSSNEFYALENELVDCSWQSYEAVRIFRNEFTNYLGVKYGVAVNSGTSALELAVTALGIGKGDEVIVPACTFYSTASCVAKAGATPIFVDVNLEDVCISVSQIKMAITAKTKAILVVHWGGHTADLGNILEICQTHNLFLIEDVAQAVGAEWNGRRLGSIGDAGCFSFQGTKLLTAGEGGFIATNNENIYRTAHALSDYGHFPGDSRFEHVMLGGNYKMTKFQALLLSLNLKKLDKQIEQRQDNADYLRSLLSQIPGITPLTIAPYASRVTYYLFGFHYDKKQFGHISKSEFVSRIRKQGISINDIYNYPLYNEPVFRAMNPEKSTDLTEELRFKNSLQVCETLVGFDHPVLLANRKDLDKLSHAIRSVSAQVNR